jgi:VWFA-related protein
VPVFKVETNLQTIAVRVTDKQGNDVDELSAEDFTLLENGQHQKIAFFGVDYEPLSLTILIDSSSSMESGGKLNRARTVLGPLIRGNHPEDEVSLLPFTDEVGRIQPLTSEQRLDPPRTKVAMRAGGTALYDALASALCHMKSARHPRQAIVAITDGADQHSRLRLEQLIELARSSNPQIFMIGFYDRSEYEIYRQRSKTVTLVSGREIDNPLIAFRRLAEESGAESFFPTSDRDLKLVLDRISAIIQAQYTLAYYPSSVARVREIKVKVKRRGVNVGARSHVGSDTGDGAFRFMASCEVSANDHPYPWESPSEPKPLQDDCLPGRLFRSPKRMAESWWLDLSARRIRNLPFYFARHHNHRPSCRGPDCGLRAVVGGFPCFGAGRCQLAAGPRGSRATRHERRDGVSPQ